MAVEFVRFVVPTWMHRESQAPIGVIGAAYELLRQDTASLELRRELEHWIEWFEENLPIPDRFNRTKSKGWYRRETRGIAWLRTSATDHLTAMADLAGCIAKCGHATVELRSERVGYVVYEDEIQVIAEPFRDTPESERAI
jgi:hypothetical protein